MQGEVAPSKAPPAGKAAPKRRLSSLLSWLRSFWRLIRRTRRGSGLLRAGGAVIEAAAYSVAGPRGRVRLTRTEWRLLTQLLASRGQVLTHEEIIDAVWGPQYRDAPRLLHDAMSRLRRRFSAAGLRRELIETVHGIGYRLREGC